MSKRRSLSPTAELARSKTTTPTSKKAIAVNPGAIGPAIVAEAGRVAVASGAAARPA